MDRHIRPASLIILYIVSIAILLREKIAPFLEQQQVDNEPPRCRCIPGDPCWPSQTEWSQFNTSLGGKLILNNCHPNNAFTSPDVPYMQHAVNVSSARDCQLTLDFTQQHNIRLILQDAKLDCPSESTGPGALVLRTHSLRNISFLDYGTPYYVGKAMKIDAGVSSWEAQAAAHEQGLLVVGSDCPDAGLVEHTQRGGHSTLFSKYGLAADQVLEWEVVTADGRLLVASPVKNANLYWALTGSGNGAYGVVLSMAVRAYPETQVAAAKLSFSSDGVPLDTFYDAIKTVLLGYPVMNNAGVGSLWSVINGVFEIQPIIAPSLTVDELTDLLRPSLDALDESGISYDFKSENYPSYFDSYEAMSPQYEISPLTHVNSRFIPRYLIESETAITPLMDTIKFLATHNVGLLGMSLNVSRAPILPNSVRPMWRTAGFIVTYGAMFHENDHEANTEDLKVLTDVLEPRIEEIMPGCDAYLNEGNSCESNFKEVIYDSNYGRLKSIKEKWDPEDFLYSPTAVGSEAWKIESDGRLCRIKQPSNPEHDIL
ncbi:uncharacterized protein F4822DRAFT_184412 [Hypoxylon trugodes]|uniref:uncharacterized protein n=1 Tax=Hypoxylon trugodes TaxID=326681 RepID=UPI0021992D89|nr:uncharacterized protein F4822DRAFT_184412 [Hypoxylon trugodes]KAI1391385.1 hypothetical protein F4822DRAFT_184412 [Hypoxylon trugodes]